MSIRKIDLVLYVRVGVTGRYTLTINFKVGREPWRAKTTMFLLVGPDFILCVEFYCM